LAVADGLGPPIFEVSGGAAGDSHEALATTKTHQWCGEGHAWAAAGSRGDGPMGERQMTVSFVGLGYVGLCTAVAFANRGFDTLGVDVDLERLALVEVGRVPVDVPGLERLLKTATLSGRRRVSDRLPPVAETAVSSLTAGR